LIIRWNNIIEKKHAKTSQKNTYLLIFFPSVSFCLGSSAAVAATVVVAEF
jgi:hypothetical protein